MTRNNRELVEAASLGDRSAFAELHGRYAGMIHAILLSRVPGGDVDDLAQDVFLTAINKIHTLANGEAVGGWLARVARNRAADFHRRGPPPAVPLPENLTRAESQQPWEILATIRELPEAYSETLMMRLVEGMTGPEIARHTGLTEGSVRVNLHRGMKLLRERLGGSS